MLLKLKDLVSRKNLNFMNKKLILKLKKLVLGFRDKCRLARVFKKFQTILCGHAKNVPPRNK